MLLAKYHNVEFEAGCDEAGRGCLAGSVFAAAVIFPEGYENAEIKDSKNSRQRNATPCARRLNGMHWRGL